MDNTTLLNIMGKAKLALRIRTSAFDDEIRDLILAAYKTLITRGVTITITDSEVDPMVLRAILTYVRMYFGQPDDYERLKEAWEIQLGQLMITTNYTTWSD